ncbi:MAG TPA: TonB family protein [Blastocatellia bacterium]|nr:TonB family protein [Blastocatellia bacterium]
MVWHKNNEEFEELRDFVEGMKRGQTLATSDSLLETLRQIHDRREAPITGHDHRRMLLERLRRQAAERSGEYIEDTIPAPAFLSPPAKRRRAIEWAVAASIAVHVAVGAAVLPNVHFSGLFAGGVDTAEASPEVLNVQWVTPLVLPNRKVDRTGHPTTETSSTEVEGRSRTAPAGEGAGVSVPAPSSAPIGAPVATGVEPIVPSYDPGSIADQADRNIPDDTGPSMVGPEKMRPTSDVRLSEVMSDVHARPASASAGDVAITEVPDVAPKLLVTPRPMYTEKALAGQVRGSVRLTVVFGADGAIHDVQILRGLGFGLDEAAIQAVRQIKFIPGSRAGKPVSVRRRIDVSFDLR